MQPWLFEYCRKNLCAVYKFFLPLVPEGFRAFTDNLGIIKFDDCTAMAAAGYNQYPYAGRKFGPYGI